MAKSKGSSQSTKVSFGRRKGGRPVKSYNKHHTKSSYKKRQGAR